MTTHKATISDTIGWPDAGNSRTYSRSAMRAMGNACSLFLAKRGLNMDWREMKHAEICEVLAKRKDKS